MLHLLRREVIKARNHKHLHGNVWCGTAHSTNFDISIIRHIHSRVVVTQDKLWLLYGNSLCPNRISHWLLCIRRLSEAWHSITCLNPSILHGYGLCHRLCLAPRPYWLHYRKFESVWFHHAHTLRSLQLDPARKPINSSSDWERRKKCSCKLHDCSQCIPCRYSTVWGNGPDNRCVRSNVHSMLHIHECAHEVFWENYVISFSKLPSSQLSD